MARLEVCDLALRLDLQALLTSCFPGRRSLHFRVSDEPPAPIPETPGHPLGRGICARSGRWSARRRGPSSTVYRPGEICQFDLWEPGAEIPVGHGQTRKGYVVVACLGYSRAGAGALVFSKQTPELLFPRGASPPTPRHGSDSGRLAFFQRLGVSPVTYAALPAAVAAAREANDALASST